MKMEYLLDKIRFEGIESGDYEQKPIICTRQFSSFNSMDSIRGIKNKLLGARHTPDKTSRAHEIKITKGPENIFYSKQILERKSKPIDIERLEEVLSSSYNVNVAIASVNDIPVTRKEVREVYFIRNDDPEKMYKVWVFKADPVATLKELTVYHIIYEQGIPTGKPVGYKPSKSDTTYPYDIAILGGIVENAGDSYSGVIKNMRMLPDKIFQTAKDIAQIIADYHIKLTHAKDEFARYGIDLHEADIGREIRERLIAGLGIEARLGDRLIDACTGLQSIQSRLNVVSHEDINEKNIVSVKSGDAILYRKFGVIDWESIAINNPFSDLCDFWIHHKRQALNICGEYDFSFEEFVESYAERFQKKTNRQWTDFDKDRLRTDSLVQSVIWNIYEMYDPVRDDPEDIKDKAITHCQALWDDLRQIENLGNKAHAGRIKKGLKILLKDKAYLHPVLNL